MATSNQQFNDFLDSIIESANYLRNIVDIPEHADFRDALFDVIKDADSTIGDAADMVNEFDEDEW